MNFTEVVIIGAGPAGLFSVFELGMLKIPCHVIDILDVAGGQCQALYPEKPIYDIPAYPEISAHDLIAKLKEQIKPFNPKFHLKQIVEKLEKQPDNTFIVTTNTGNQIHCKAIIIAAGAGAFGPNRPPLHDIEKYEGTSVHYHISNREIFRDKTVAIAGGGDSAIDWSIILADIAKKVYLIHRRASFRASPENMDRIKTLESQGKIEMIVPFQLHNLEGNSKNVEKISVKSLNGEEKILEAQHLLAFFGLKMDLGPILQFDLNIDHHHIAVDVETMQSSQTGIYAIGDVCRYKNKLKLILSGFHEAAVAAHQIYNYLYPDKPLHFQYSTTSGVNKI